MANLLELPFMALTGLVVAVFAAAFIRLQCLCCRLSLNRPIWLRFTIAGGVTGLLALWLPQIMGVGYDTISSALSGEIGLGVLFAILLAKLLATGVSLGAGMPGGVVGPCLFMGACVGGAVGVIAHFLMPDSASDIGFYVILGMGAMMGAVLNAPLAAMIAILELTYNPNIIFPSMLVVVAACLTTRWVFHCDGLFQTLLHIQGKSQAQTNPESSMIHQLLSRSGVRSLMDKHILRRSRLMDFANAQHLLNKPPHWILLEEEQLLIHPADVIRYLEQKPIKSENDPPIDLLEIPAKRMQMTPISLEANLFEAISAMNRAQVDALCVIKTLDELPDTTQLLAGIKGIITREKIETYYRV
jgi:hypothetical protein